MLEILAEVPLAFVAVAFVFALVVGSFLNVVIYRLPIMMERDWREQCADIAENPTLDIPDGRFNLVVPRSRCPSCGTQIAAMQNIPVLSYLALGGRCAACKESIPRSLPDCRVCDGIARWDCCMAIWRDVAGAYGDSDDPVPGPHHRNRF